MSGRVSSARKPATKSARKPSAAKPAASAAKKAGSSKPKPRKASAKKPAAKRSTAAAGTTQGAAIYQSVEKLVADGMTAKDAFGVVAKERKMTASNVQQHYYRYKRKASGPKKKKPASSTSTARKTVRRTQKVATNVALQAAAAAAPVIGRASDKIPAKQKQQLGKAIQAVSEVDLKEDAARIGDDIVEAFFELLDEARKNPRFRKLEKGFVELINR
jgi:hypothetical protein